jgi:hypothetical protein
MTDKVTGPAESGPGVDRRSFLKGSSVAMVGTALATAGFAVPAVSAEPQPAGKAAEEIQNQGKDLMAGWLAV